jgi:hypothetical protein
MTANLLAALSLFFVAVQCQYECGQEGVQLRWNLTSGSLADEAGVLANGDAQQSNGSHPIGVDNGAHFEDVPFQAGLFVGGEGGSLGEVLVNFSVHIEWRSRSVVADRQYLWQMPLEGRQGASPDYPLDANDMLAGCYLVRMGAAENETGVECSILLGTGSSPSVRTVSSYEMVGPGSYYLTTLQYLKFGGSNNGMLSLHMNESRVMSTSFLTPWHGIVNGPNNTYVGTPAACGADSGDCFGFVGDVYSFTVTNESVNADTFSAGWASCVHAADLEPRTTTTAATNTADATSTASATTLRPTGGVLDDGVEAAPEADEDEAGDAGSGGALMLLLILVSVGIVCILCVALLLVYRSRRNRSINGFVATPHSPVSLTALSKDARDTQSPSDPQYVTVALGPGGGDERHVVGGHT